MRRFFEFIKTAVTLAMLLAVSVTLVASEAVAAPAKQQEGGLITVEVEGEAPVVDGKKGEARQEALRAVSRNALEQALGAYVEGITVMENFEVVKDKVFSQTQGIVKKVDVLSEKVDDDGLLRVTARCQVSAAALDGVLGPVMIDMLGNPRVMVLIDERIGDKQSFLSSTEGEVLRVFEKAGYLLVDPSQAGLLKDIDLDAARQNQDPDALREIARTFRADVIISGKAYGSSFANQKISGVNIYGVRSTVQLRAVLTNSAYMLGSDTIEEKTQGVSVEDGAVKGFQAGTPKAASSLVHKVAYAMVSGSAGGIPGKTVSVRVAAISLKDARVLQDLLNGLEGVTGVYQRAYRQKTLEIDVVSDKTAEELAYLLSDNGVDVEDITSVTIEGRSMNGD
jgi:hypothetical protein